MAGKKIAVKKYVVRLSLTTSNGDTGLPFRQLSMQTLTPILIVRTRRGARYVA